MKLSKEQTLCGVSYTFSSGMVFGTSISIRITDEKMSATYFPWENIDNYDGDEREPVTIDNAPTEKEKWEQVEKALLCILPEIEIKKKKIFSPYSNMHALDADSEYFSVILRDKNGDEKAIECYVPRGEKFTALLDIMKETVHPTGRTIKRFD